MNGNDDEGDGGRLDVDEPSAQPPRPPVDDPVVPITPAAPRRPLVASVGLVLVVATAVLGSNLFGFRDRLFGSATPDPAPAVVSRVAGAGTAPTAEPTRLRSQPWWQAVTTLEGSGSTTAAPVTIDGSAIQWRVRWTCETGRLVVQAPQRPTPLVDSACPGGDDGLATRTGVVTMKVTADGPWKLEVEQQVDVPLIEPPLPAMSAPGAVVLARGSLYNIDKTGTGTLTIYRLADGSRALRLDNFYVTPSPELEVRLSPLKEPKSSPEYIASPSELITTLDVTTGSVNIAIPDSIDLTKYGSVVIWCQPVDSAYAAVTLGPGQ